MRYVILPQAIHGILPARGNQLVYMLKVLSLVLVDVSAGVRWLERRMNTSDT